MLLRGSPEMVLISRFVEWKSRKQDSVFQSGSAEPPGSASGCQGFRRSRPKLPGTKFETTVLCRCSIVDTWITAKVPWRNANICGRLRWNIKVKKLCSATQSRTLHLCFLLFCFVEFNSPDGTSQVYFLQRSKHLSNASSRSFYSHVLCILCRFYSIYCVAVHCHFPAFSLYIPRFLSHNVTHFL